MVDTVYKILDGIYSTTTSIEGLRFLDKFTTDEANDFARRIAVNLNKYPEDFIELTRKRIVDNIPDDTRIDIFNKTIKDLFRLQIANKLTDKTYPLLIYWLMLDYSYKFPTNNISLELKEVYEFFISHLLELNEVNEQVILDKVQATTYGCIDNFIRVSADGIVPTEKTKEIFKHYLNY